MGKQQLLQQSNRGSFGAGHHKSGGVSAVRGIGVANAPPRTSAKAALRAEKAAEISRQAQSRPPERTKSRRLQQLLAVQAEQAALRKVQDMYRHLVPFEDLRQELYLLAKYMGLQLHRLVVAVAVVEVLLGVVGAIIFVMALPMMFRAGFQIVALMCYILVRAICLLFLALCFYLLGQSTAAFGRSTWAYFFYYQQRTRLRGTQDDCPVCLGNFQEDPSSKVRTLGCGHCFHAECIRPWLSQKKFCPLCRAY